MILLLEYASEETHILRASLKTQDRVFRGALQVGEQVKRDVLPFSQNSKENGDCTDTDRTFYHWIAYAFVSPFGRIMSCFLSAGAGSEPEMALRRFDGDHRHVAIIGIFWWVEGEIDGRIWVTNFSLPTSPLSALRNFYRY